MSKTARPIPESRAIRLPSVDHIPVIGLGTYPFKGSQCEALVAHALKVGYRHIDTAVFYANHDAVGAALQSSGCKREEVFLTTKIWPDKLRYDDVLQEVKCSLEALRTGYLDLLLIHWPNADIPVEETLRAMDELKKSGLIRNYGVSNFTIDRLKESLSTKYGSGVVVNQVECHPYLPQEGLREWCARSGLVLAAYSPLAQGKVASDPVLQELGRKNGRTPGQIALRWLIQRGIVVVPRSSSTQRLEENFHVTGWSLTPEEMAMVSGIRKRLRLVNWDIAGFDET